MLLAKLRDYIWKREREIGEQIGFYVKILKYEGEIVPPGAKYDPVYKKWVGGTPVKVYSEHYRKCPVIWATSLSADLEVYGFVRESDAVIQGDIRDLSLYQQCIENKTDIVVGSSIIVTPDGATIIADGTTFLALEVAPTALNTSVFVSIRKKVVKE